MISYRILFVKFFLAFFSKQVTSLSLSMDGSILMSGSKDCTARIWDVASRQCLRVLQHKGKKRERITLIIFQCLFVFSTDFFSHSLDSLLTVVRYSGQYSNLISYFRKELQIEIVIKLSYRLPCNFILLGNL